LRVRRAFAVIGVKNLFLPDAADSPGCTAGLLGRVKPDHRSAPRNDEVPLAFRANCRKSRAKRINFFSV
jgi:hypothetical protein